MRAVRFLAAAEREARDAAQRYEAASPGLGWDFRRRLQAALDRMAESPALGRPLSGGFRSVALERFPYRVIYREGNSGLVVVAVAHHRRAPEYWRHA